jgi:DNA-binding GntR family transcriptional regulator
MSAEEEAERYVRGGVPEFVIVYDVVLDHLRAAGYGPGQRLPGEVALAQELAVERDLLHEVLLLLEEDGYVARGRDRMWAVAAPPPGPVRFAESFHRLLGAGVRPVRRLHVSLEEGSSWAHDLLGVAQTMLAWETVYALDDVLLASSLELMLLDAVPEELTRQLDPEKHDPVAQPSILECLGAERRAGLVPEVWRLSSLSRATERLAWMELPLHGIPAALTVVLSEGGRPVYLAKNIFDLGTFDLEVNQLRR